jgi:positive regulator of sigma E activity
VLGIVRESSRDRLTVELARPRPCEGCSGACLWYRMPPQERLELAANGAIPVGASVAVTLPDRYLVAGAALLYGLPLVSVLAGAVAAVLAFGSDLAAAVGAAVALPAAFLAAAPLRRRLERATLRQLAVRHVP